MKKKSFLVYPYIIWSAIFIVIPLILVVLFSFTQKIDGKQVFSIANYKDLMDPIYFKVFLRSIILAGGSTLICLIVGYPVAYLISKVNVSKRGTYLCCFIYLHSSDRPNHYQNPLRFRGNRNRLFTLEPNHQAQLPF